ncbi:OmpA family protein [Bacteroidales bacterium OttesenSCG-928-M11]|nr:OmpA family protein [Bacteroidales bacterium OttesenSCG-928-M11]
MKKIIAILTIGLLTVSTFAQNEQRKHEFSIWAGGGISSLDYDLPNGFDHEKGLGGFAGIGYNYFFHYNWSVGVGAEFSLLQSKAKFNSNEYSYTTTMDARPGGGVETFDMRFSGNMEETQKGYYVNVPIKLQFQTDVYKRNKLYAAVGAKIGFPVMDANADYSGSYSVKGWQVRNGGHVTEDPFVDMPDRGFTSGSMSADKDFSLADLNIIGTVELGMKWPVKSGKNAWYTGLYFDYGFSDVRPDAPKSGRPGYVNGDGTFNSIVESNWVDKVNTISFGAKVAFAFGFGGKHVKALPVEKPFEGVTPEQMNEIVNRNTGIIVDAMDRNFDELYKHLEKECPELFEPVPIDELESIVQFDFDKDNVKNVYFPDIDRKIAIMKKYPEVKITLVGHTDNRGTDQYNYNLGQERAQAVKDYMVAKGISADRLFVESQGKAQPIVPNTTDENRYKNRRVEFIMKQ